MPRAQQSSPNAALERCDMDLWRMELWAAERCYETANVGYNEYAILYHCIYRMLPLLVGSSKKPASLLCPDGTGVENCFGPGTQYQPMALLSPRND